MPARIEAAPRDSVATRVLSVVAPTPGARALPGLVVLFFASGASALVYQVLWLRLLSLVFGVTVYAASALLASFMAGLAAGSSIGGRIADRTRSPLRWFGVVEIGIGVLALLTHLLLDAATPMYVTLQSRLPDIFALQMALRFVGSFVLLLGPVTLMGMTLPFMLKAATSHHATSGRRIAVLYATNTAGAVCGVLAAGYYLVGTVGILASFQLAALANVATGVAALVWSAAAPDIPEPPVAKKDTAGRAALPGIASVVFALSGFAALALEVVWLRILVYFVPATTYAFSTLLAAVLLGLALGSYAATPLLSRVDRLLPRIAWLHGSTAVVTPLCAIAVAAAYRAGWHTTSDVHVSVLLAFPPAFLMGMAYPVGLRIWATDDTHGSPLDATKVGDLNSTNVIGAILGAVTGGFVVLPVAGTRVGLAVCSGIYVVSFVLLTAYVFPRRSRVAWSLALVLPFVAVAVNVPDMLQSVSARRYTAEERLVWSEEGAQTTAAVNVREGGGRVLYLDGLHQASDHPDIVKLHRLIGHLPMVLHPDPARAIVVGLGGGVTAGAVGRHGVPVDLVELSPSVVAAAAFFTHVNHDVLKQPGVSVRIDDGRNFLLARGGRYDVLTADLIQPEHAGAGNLYSVEYFRLARKALAPQGLALQWLGHRRDDQYRLIMRTFLAVFPEATLWADGQLLVGSVAPLAVSREAFERKLRQPPIRTALAEIDITGFEDLLALYTAGPPALRAFAGEGPLLTDDRPMIEYFRSLPSGGGGMVDLSALRGGVPPQVP